MKRPTKKAFYEYMSMRFKCNFKDKDSRCYIMAIPFFGFTVLSTLIFALLIELVLKIKNKNNPLYIWE